MDVGKILLLSSIVTTEFQHLRTCLVVLSSDRGTVELCTAAAEAFEASTDVCVFLNMDAHVEVVALRLCSATLPFTRDVLLTDVEVLNEMILDRPS